MAESNAVGDHLLSKFFYQQKCVDLQTQTSTVIAEVSHLIEPLVGLLRDPLTICPRTSAIQVPSALYDGAIVQSKRFLLLSVSAPFTVHPTEGYAAYFEKIQQETASYQRNLVPWMYGGLNYFVSSDKMRLKMGQTFLFDLGSSFFDGWHGDSTAVAGLWFHENYKRFNVTFDRIITFEQSVLDQKTAWKALPNDVFPAYTLINVGVTENETFNPWKMLRAITHVYDYVVVKLDIDTPLLENALINQILRNPSIHSLIDELFFEHHVTVKEMIPYWGTPQGTLKDSYHVFRKMRELGIRMHSWP